MKNRLLILTTLSLALAVPACNTTTTTKPDGTVTKTQTLDPAAETAIANGSIILTGALAQKYAPVKVTAQK